MAEDKPLTDIPVALVSRDPFFLFASRGLLGRDRRARILLTADTLADCRSGLATLPGHVDVVVCDLDSTAEQPGFLDDLGELCSARKAICLASANLVAHTAALCDLPVAALLCKADLHYALHLVIAAVTDYEARLVTPTIKPLLREESLLHREAHTIGPRRLHPDLSERQEQVVMLRVFVGLDNPDMGDELQLSDYTIREHVSMAYKSLGASNELDVFEAISDWWWTTRFARALLG
jgi:DNA-binding NarL/FixJ family response regulator